MDQTTIIKALLIGKDKTGKTSLMSSFTNKSFDQSYTPTIGVDFSVKTINNDGKTYKIQLWDSAGQEKFKSITTAYYKGAQMFFVVYDITNLGSFNSIPSYLSEVNEIANTENKIVVLLGNKSDLESERVVSFNEGETLAQSNGISFFEVSATIDGSFDNAVLFALNKLTGDEAAIPPAQED